MDPDKDYQESFDISLIEDDEMDIVNFDYNDYSLNIPTSAFTISLGPIETHRPPPQLDMFRHYISSQWLHSDIVDEDLNPQWQIEAWIDDKPFLREAKQEGNLEIIEAQGQGDDSIDFYYVGSPEEYCVWRLRWSEYFEQCGV